LIKPEKNPTVTRVQLSQSVMKCMDTSQADATLLHLQPQPPIVTNTSQVTEATSLNQIHIYHNWNIDPHCPVFLVAFIKPVDPCDVVIKC